MRRMREWPGKIVSELSRCTYYMLYRHYDVACFLFLGNLMEFVKGRNQLGPRIFVKEGPFASICLLMRE